MNRLLPSALLLALIAFAPLAMAATTIPFVGCVEQGATPNDASWTAPAGRPYVTSLPAAVAAKLALYASNWSAVLGPRGWACRSNVVEQQGVAMIVSPEPAQGDDRGILSGPAIILWNDQAPAAVAAYTESYFPDAIAAIKADQHYCGAACAALLTPSHEAPLFQADIIHPDGAFIIAYTTPAHNRGLGNQIGAPVQGEPSLAEHGFLALSNLPRGEGGVVNLTVRLPANLQYLNAAILKTFRPCLPNNNTLACESGGAFTAQGRPIDDGD